MILFFQLLLQIVSLPLLLFVTESFTEQDTSSCFVQLMIPDHTIFCSGTESALDKLWTGTRTGTVALYKHYKLYKPNKPNKTRVCKYAPARSSSENELVKEWTGEKENMVRYVSRIRSSDLLNCLDQESLKSRVTICNVRASSEYVRTFQKRTYLCLTVLLPLLYQSSFL